MRVFLIVLDSVGIGELPDAGLYGDEGSNTLGNLAEAVGGLDLPNFAAMGLGNIAPISGVGPVENTTAAYGKMSEVSAGKDTTTGHWEMMGIHLKEPFPVYPYGFPTEIIDAFESKIERKILGNYPASGTVIIEELGEIHIKTGRPIVYTSADSVFQIAAHEDIVPVEELYRWCRKAREILKGKHAVARVIARPFIGTPGKFERTSNRKDFALPPPGKTALDLLGESGIEVWGLGKIHDIFCGRGIAKTRHAGHSDELKGELTTMLNLETNALIFANFVDFDMVYGHRNNAPGYAAELQSVDSFLGDFKESLTQDDILIVTADHGCDPTTESTDHSREYVPLLLYGKKVLPVDLGTRESFSDLGKSLLHLWNVDNTLPGKSFLPELGLS